MWVLYLVIWSAYHGPLQEPEAEARIRCELEAASGGQDDGNFSRYYTVAPD